MSANSRAKAWALLQRQVIACDRCVRLREHCTKIAAEKRAAFADQMYWGKPVPNFGLPEARLLIVGLAPAAHGANRTGRVFTGDRSGDFLFRALFEAGFANQPTSSHAKDGLLLKDAVITAIARCAPPDNKPLPTEIANCADYLEQTFDLIKDLREVVALGRIAFDACLRLYRKRGWLGGLKERPVFRHGVCYRSESAPTLIACFHPSQQNTFTGRLTPRMMLDVFEGVARRLNEDGGPCPPYAQRLS